MREVLLVDGYNVINAWPELKALALVNLEHARAKLVSILANYQGLTGWHTVLVFDAHGVKGVGERTVLAEGIEIIFSRENETADAVIERLAYEMRGDFIRVVTSDWEEQKAVFGSGAHRLPVRLFREEVIRAEKESGGFEKTVVNGGALENRLPVEVRKALETWRRMKY